MNGSAPSVNFIKIQKKVEKQKTKKSRLFVYFGYGLLGLYGIGLVSMWGLGVFLGIQINSLDAKIAQEKQKITALRTVETKYMTILDKVRTIEKINSSGIPFHALSEAIFGLIPEGMEVSGFVIDEKGLISFSAKAASINILEKYYQNLEQMKTGSVTVDSSIISGLVIDEHGACTFSNTLKLTIKS